MCLFIYLFIYLFIRHAAMWGTIKHEIPSPKGHMSGMYAAASVSTSILTALLAGLCGTGGQGLAAKDLCRDAKLPRS